jgi:hypothetical protein
VNNLYSKHNEVARPSSRSRRGRVTWPQAASPKLSVLSQFKWSRLHICGMYGTRESQWDVTRWAAIAYTILFHDRTCREFKLNLSLDPGYICHQRSFLDPTADYILNILCRLWGQERATNAGQQKLCFSMHSPADAGRDGRRSSSLAFIPAVW